MTKHRGTTIPKPQWWKHLRPFGKLMFWKRERQAGKKEAK